MNQGSVQEFVDLYDGRITAAMMLLTDSEFKRLIGVSKEIYNFIFRELKPWPPLLENDFSAEVKLLLTLNFLSRGSYELAVARNDVFTLSRSTVNRIVREVVYMMGILYRKYVAFPKTDEEMDEISNWFQNEYNIPNVIGLIDGTHFAIRAPVDRPGRCAFNYRNRKGFHSINVQIITDNRYYIRSMNEGFTGSVGDAWMWKLSDVRNRVETLYQRKQVGLLADRGYPLEPWILGPFKRPANDAQHLFNENHKKAYCVIERCLGVFRKRWRCVENERRALDFEPHTAVAIIYACAALHNICLSQDPEYLEDDANK